MITGQKTELKNMLVVVRLEHVINDTTHYDDNIKDFCKEVLEWAENLIKD